VPGLRSVAADEIERIALHDVLADVGVTDPAAVERWLARHVIPRHAGSHPGGRGFESP